MKFQSVVVFAALLLFSLESRAQTAAFTYQGKLSDSGSAANGNYDFRFRLFDVNTNLVGGPITNSAVAVTNGQFIATLNFGSAVFNGSDVWLEIAVRSNGTAVAFAPLSPLQQITSVPYAIQSLNAANASTATNLAVALPGTNISGTISVANLPANVAFLNSNQVFTGANTFGGANVFSGAFTGNGNGLTNLAATNLIGTLPDARLSSNVPLLNTNQIFTSSNIFTGTVTATNAANNFVGTFSGTFSGNGAAIKNLTATNLVGTLPDTNLSANVALQSNTVINFAGTVSATNFVGAGHGLTNVPGAFFWVTVAGASVQMFPNVGDICTNNVTAVTNTLPVSPSVGDTFKVVGVGAAGWTVAQNAGQTILSGNLSGSVGQSWVTNGISTNWSDITCSSDGTKMGAVVGDTLGNFGLIYTNDNSGKGTWTSRSSAGSGQWVSVASSADGTKMVAANYGSAGTASPGIYTSSDSGGTWTSDLTVSSCTSVASSADGTKMVAVISGGSIYTNSGTTWKAVGSTSGLSWVSVASSADGTKLVAAVNGGYIYTSTNSGATWTQHASSFAWSAVASSADGTRLIAAQTGGNVYISTDSGNTWAVTSDNDSGAWSGATSSSDGSRLAVAYAESSAGYIDVSSDSGNTWSQQFGAGNLDFSSVTCSADGSLLAATVHGGKIYVSSQSSTTTGMAGYLSGAQHSAVELIYVGNGDFLPLNHEGTIRAY